MDVTWLKETLIKETNKLNGSVYDEFFEEDKEKVKEKKDLIKKYCNILGLEDGMYCLHYDDPLMHSFLLTSVVALLILNNFNELSPKKKSPDVFELTTPENDLSLFGITTFKKKLEFSLQVPIEEFVSRLENMTCETVKVPGKGVEYLKTSLENTYNACMNCLEHTVFLAARDSTRGCCSSIDDIVFQLYLKAVFDFMFEIDEKTGLVKWLNGGEIHDEKKLQKFILDHESLI